MTWFLAAIACSGSGTEPEPPPGETPEALVERLAEPGPYAVGHLEQTVTWSLPGVQADPRELRLAVWYPTEASSGDPVSYFFGTVFAEAVHGGAPVAPGTFPLVVFSHGHQGYAEASSFLCEHLASHGLVVASPDHTDNTSLDGDERTTAIYWQRPLDLSAVLDHVLDAAPGEPLAGAAVGPVVAMGHSFGGYTVHGMAGATFEAAVVADCLDGADTSAFCSTMDAAQAEHFEGELLVDPRVGGIVSMAAGDHRLFEAGLAAIDVPVLLMSGGLDAAAPLGEATWSDLDGGDDVFVHLPTGGHNAFSDFAGALDPPGVIEPEAGWRIIRTYALAAALTWTGSDPAASTVLDGTASVSDHVEHQTR